MDIQLPSLVASWQQASQVVSAGGTPPYLLTVRAEDKWIETPAEMRRLDSIAAECGAERPSSVANMLLPRPTILCNRDTADCIDVGLKFLGKGRRKGLRYSGWIHTYFERMSGFWIDQSGHRQQIGEPRLENVINKINKWNKDVVASLYIHIFNEADTLKVRGSPCLQYIQFRLHSTSIIDVVGLYRSHDYFNKALGNMVGLQRLGNFVASQTGRTYGGAYLVSLNPFSEGGKRALVDYAARII